MGDKSVFDTEDLDELIKLKIKEGDSTLNLLNIKLERQRLRKEVEKIIDETIEEESIMSINSEKVLAIINRLKELKRKLGI